MGLHIWKEKTPLTVTFGLLATQAQAELCSLEALCEGSSDCTQAPLVLYSVDLAGSEIATNRGVFDVTSVFERGAVLGQVTLSGGVTYSSVAQADGLVAHLRAETGVHSLFLSQSSNMSVTATLTGGTPRRFVEDDDMMRGRESFAKESFSRDLPI